MQAVGLFCERDDRILIQDLVLALHPGEVMQIEGPNGSGKTTLLRILCGLSDDFEGEIHWQGQPRNRVDADFRRDTLYFGHLTGIKSSLTPRENLRWILQLKGIATDHNGMDEQIDAALNAVGLYSYEDVPVYSLSAGQKRRVALARLHVEPAHLWVLDEPFTAIDRNGVTELEGLIQNHAENGGAVLITTHHALELPAIRKLHLGLGRGTWRIQ